MGWAAQAANGQGSIDAVFEVRKAAAEPDAILPGETLNLEVLLTLSSASTIPGVNGVSFALDLDDATENNIISYNLGSWLRAPVFDFGSVSGTPNTPVTGEFNAGVSSFQTGGVTFGNGVAGLVGSFAITGLNPGQVSYTFTDKGATGPWVVNLVPESDTVNLLNGPSLAITVIPEPASAILLLLAAGGALMRRRWR
jgi:hypothetical protein